MGAVYNGFTPWPDNAVELGTDRVIELYKEGMAGAFQDPEESDKLNEAIAAKGGIVDGNDVAERFGFAGEGDGALVILYPAVVKSFGLRALTKPGQKTGDCVSMGFRDGSLYLICLEHQSQLPDEATLRLEGLPDVSDLAIQNGVFCNEGIYKHRNHNGQGMSCSQGANWVTTEGGILVRKKYDQVNLETYNVGFETTGRGGSPQWMDDLAKQHPVRDCTRPKGHEAGRDFIARGKPVVICMSLGFSSTRGEWGYAQKSGSWSHSIHIIGADYRASTIRKFGFPLALAGHRWAIWNKGDRRIFESQDIVDASERAQWKELGMMDSEGYVLIPEGYWWMDARLLDRCDLYALSGAAGWDTASLPNYLGGLQ